MLLLLLLLVIVNELLLLLVRLLVKLDRYVLRSFNRGVWNLLLILHLLNWLMLMLLLLRSLRLLLCWLLSLILRVLELTHLKLILLNLLLDLLDTVLLKGKTIDCDGLLSWLLLLGSFVDGGHSWVRIRFNLICLWLDLSGMGLVVRGHCFVHLLCFDRNLLDVLNSASG